MIRDEHLTKGLVVAHLVLFFFCGLPVCQAYDACLERPWQGTGPSSAQTVSVTLTAFEELQQHIDAATGPTVFVVQSRGSSLVANRPVQISKADITVTSSVEALINAKSVDAVQLLVNCTSAGSLLQIRAQGFRLLGFSISGCSSSAVQLVSAKRSVLRHCTFSSNTNIAGSIGGAAVAASKSQIWVDSCSFTHNSVIAGPGGAVSAVSSQLLITNSQFTSNKAANVAGAVALQGRADTALTASVPACWKDIDGILDSVKLQHNEATLQGGALATNGSHVVVQASNAVNNRAKYGGVVYAGEAAQVAIRSNSFFGGNTATSSGGVAYAIGPAVRILLQSSSFAGNMAAILGGVLSARDEAAVKLDGSSFNNNTAKLAAGVVYARYADMTASNCRFRNNSAVRDGGALYCASNCHWTIRGSQFVNNMCEGNGGAAFAWNSNVTISSSRLEGNTAGPIGGAIAVANTTLDMASCMVGSNSATGIDATGGGVYSQSSDLNVTDSTFRGNTATWGGAVSATNGTLALTGGSVVNSSVTGSGAGLYLLRTASSLMNVTFEYNDAQKYGGSLYCNASSCSLTGCNISYDSASLGAGGIWVANGILSLQNSRVVGCVAKTEGGGGLHAESASRVSVVASSLVGCHAMKGAGGALQAQMVEHVSVSGSLLSDNHALTGGSIASIDSTVSIDSSGLHNSTATVGGCLAASANSTVFIHNGTFISGNEAAVGGGLALDSSTLRITGPTAIVQNKASQPDAAAGAPAVKQTAEFGKQVVLRGVAGGIYARSSRLFAKRLRLERNAADRVGGGGYCDRCGVRIANSSISKNSAIEEAGGLKLLNPASGSALLTSNVTANWAGVKAGGLSLMGVDLVSDIALVDVHLTNNTAAAESAGGLYVTGPLGLLMSGGELSGNAAGAAAAIAGAAAEYSSFTGLSADNFGSSTTSSSASEPAGGGMLLEGCSWAAMRDVDVWGNAAPAGCGGGIAVSLCGRFMLDGVVVEGNVAVSGGGACLIGVPGYLNIVNSSISSNRALLGGVWAGLGAILAPTPEPHISCQVPGTGGGLCVESQGQVLINNTRVSRNQARNGGAMALGLCDDSSRCSLGLLNATLVNNTAVQGGGGAAYFTTAVAPDQVLCGEDYNSSVAAGYAAGTTYITVAELLKSATFNTTPPVMPGSSSNTSNKRNNAAGDDILASISDSSPVEGKTQGVDGKDTSTALLGGSDVDSGDISSDDYTVTEAFDPTAAPASATTITFDPSSSKAATAKTKKTTSKKATTSLRTTGLSAAGSVQGDVVASTVAFDPTSLTAATATPESVDDVAVSTAGFDPTAVTAVSAVSFDPSSGATSSSIMQEAGEVDGVGWDDSYVLSTEGFDPTAMTVDTQEFGTASTADPAAEVANLQQAAASGAEAAFQARSTAATASSSDRLSDQLLHPENGKQEVATSSGTAEEHTVPGDIGQLDVRDAKEALQVLEPPLERTYTFSVGNGLTASTTEFVSSGADQGAAQVLQTPAQGGSSTETQGMQPEQQPAGGETAHVSAAEAADSLAVPVTEQIMIAVQKAGVSKKNSLTWQKAGYIHLSDLLETGVVNWSTLEQFWSPHTGPVSPAQLPKRVNSNAQMYDLYIALALALSKSQAAAALQSRQQHAGSLSSAGNPPAWQWGSRFNPFTMTCDPVQNPAACPVPNRPSVPARSTDEAHAATAQAAAAAAALAGEYGPSFNAQGAAVPTESKPHGRRLLEKNEAAAAQEAAAAVEAAVVAQGEESTAPSTGLLLQGTSQCGVFDNNTAIGAKSYGPVVTSRPAGLRVFDGSGDLTGPAKVSIATGGEVQVQVHVVDVFGGVVTSGAADYIRVRATLRNPNSGSALSSSTSVAAAALAAAPGLTTAQASSANAVVEDQEVDNKGVILSGLQQLSTRNNSLVLSGLKLSGEPGTNTTLWLKASDPSLQPASVTVSLTSCSAGFMQLAGSCQLCQPGTYSFHPDEPRCTVCPVGALCNGTVLVPQTGFWHSGPRSSQVHACINPAACARDSVKKQQLSDWQDKFYGQGLVVGKSKSELATAVDWYMMEQCADGYVGTLCANCALDSAAVKANKVSHGRVAGSCVECGDRKTVLVMYVFARLYDLALWAALTWLTWRAAKAWAKAITINPATAAATAGSLPPSTAAGASMSARVLNVDKEGHGMVLVTSEAAAAAAAGVGTSASLQAHVAVFLDYLQMLSIISFSAASYTWPKLLQAFMSGFAFVPLGTSKWVSVECLLPYQLSYWRSIVALLITAALPLFYLCTSAGVWIASILVGKTHRTSILALVVGTCLFYPLISMSALSTFSCQYLDNPKTAPGEVVNAPGSYWTIDPDLKCYEGQHLQLMLGFGVPVVLLVVIAWPLLLASMLWDSRFRIREQQQHPATRRRYLVRKTIKLCHQLLGVQSGFYRPHLYLWPVLVEVRKLVLCIVVVLVSGKAPAVQLYVLWGVLAVLLLVEWWAKPAATWPLVGLQLVSIGALQAVVYFAASFTQASLEGAASTFTGLIIAVALLVAVAFLLSLLAGLRGRSWIRKVLDTDSDGKVSSSMLVQSASKLLHLNMAPSTGVSSSTGGASSPRKRIVSRQQQESLDGNQLKSSTPQQLASWRLVFLGGKGRSGVCTDVQSADSTSNQPRQHSGTDVARGDTQGQRPIVQSPRSPGIPGLGMSLAAGSLPMTDAGENSISSAAAAAAVGTSASIDMGALHKLTASRANSSLRQQQLTPPAAAVVASPVSPIGSTSCSPVPPHRGFVAVDLRQYSASSPQQQQHMNASARSLMKRANSAQASMPSGMELQTYLSVHQWLTDSEDLTQSLGLNSSDWPSSVAGASARAPRASSRSLQECSSTPRPHRGGGSGSMALQRQQLLQQLQTWRQEGKNQQKRVAFQGHCDHPDAVHSDDEDHDPSNLRSISQTEAQQQRQQQRSTGQAAAARLREVQAASAGNCPSVSTRHQPYYALWSNVATALAAPATNRGSPQNITCRPDSAGNSGSTPDAAAAAAAAAGTRSAVRPSPFAAPAAVATAFAADPAALISAAAAAAGVAVRSVSMPAMQQPASATQPGGAAPAGRHTAYYSLWHHAAADLSGDELKAANTPGGAAHTGSASAMTAAAGAGSSSGAVALPLQEVSAQRSATAPPARHGAYIGLWQALAEELQDGPSAVGAVSSAAASPHTTAATEQQAMAQRSSPFAAAAIATAAAGPEPAAECCTVHMSSTSSSSPPEQQREQRRRSGRLSRRGRRSSAVGAVNEDADIDDAGSDASAYVGGSLD